ncbi:hypothetical protein BH18THE2_BH18THE2_26860 [soil metagenome]
MIISFFNMVLAAFKLVDLATDKCGGKEGG